MTNVCRAGSYVIFVQGWRGVFLILVEINITSTVVGFGITQKMDVLQITKLKVLSEFSVSD